MTVVDHVLKANEKILLRIPVVNRYTELLQRTFLATAETRNWSHKDVFPKEPLRRKITAITTNQAYLRTYCTNPFH